MKTPKELRELSKRLRDDGYEDLFLTGELSEAADALEAYADLLELKEKYVMDALASKVKEGK